jgi:RND family efflux transporter MFP subunit
MLLLALAGTLAFVVMACGRATKSATQYHCPMHPAYVSDNPGDCPICGMRLVAIRRADDDGPHPTGSTASPSEQDVAATAGSVPGHASIEVSEDGMRLAGVKLAVAEKGHIERTIRAAGIVRPDERRIRHVHTKVAGWIEKLYADFTGEAVQRGRPILTIYSQELLASQQEYLRARDAAQKLQGSSVVGARQGADDMLAAAKERLELFDVPAQFISALEHSGVPQRSVTLLAPVTGIVTAKEIVEGQQVEPGMELFSISDLSRVWIEADVYESEASAIHVGQDARLALPSDPGAPLSGKVKYIYPYLSPDTRTLKVRFDFANPSFKLKLEMFVDVDLTVQTDEGVVVPDSAIMDTGIRQIAFVSPTNGRFEPRVVKVGIRADGQAQVLEGIQPGERVATKANFLLDSESRLRNAISRTAAPPATRTSAP